MPSSQRQNRPLLVSFSGIDGAGKSTQIEILRSALLQSGLRVELITFWDDVAALTRFRESAGHTLFQGEKGVGTPERPVNRRDKNISSWYLTAARFLLYLLDAISLRRIAQKKVERKATRADVVIFDRYIYDQLANLSLQNFLPRTWARLLLKLVPHPDVAYLLDADPNLARARKPEYPIEFLNRSRTSYAILSRIGGMTEIPPGTVSTVAENVMRHLASKLPMPQDTTAAEIPKTGIQPTIVASSLVPVETQE